MPSVALIGPGAIGCTVAGAVLDAAAATLVICARTGFDELVVQHPTGTLREPVDVRTDPSGLMPVDVVLLATKTYDTEASLPWLNALVNDNTTVVVLQNGVTQVERVQPLVGEATVVPVAVQLPANRTAPGVVKADAPTRLVVPSGDGGDQLEAVLAGSFVDTQQSDDFTSVAWSKLALNAASVVGVLARKPNWVYQDEEAAALRLALIEETIAVANAEGANFDPDYASNLHSFLQAKVSGTGTPSILVDRLNERPTEWRDRNEIVVKRAAEHGIDVPLSAALTTLLRLGEP